MTATTTTIKIHDGNNNEDDTQVVQLRLAHITQRTVNIATISKICTVSRRDRESSRALAHTDNNPTH